MKAIAITGSFASGKSFVADYLCELGYKIFSCDDYVRKLYLDLKIQKEVIDLLIIPIFDKNLIKEIYFDDQKRKKLEDYIHPLVLKGIEDFKNKYYNEEFIFIEIPLLFEANFSHYFDYSICVYCTEESRLDRAKMRKNFNLDVYKKISKIQLPQYNKRELSDFQINTDLGFKSTKDQINQIIDDL